ncbi:MAG: glutamine cyclotransferase [Bacteroidetes bacterium MedPE-SWsnd-G2]|nr:MAG: glutamine cyclotransferase [Bacteroidetes bacterium MedPE-SWsnd-G2]
MSIRNTLIITILAIFLFNCDDKKSGKKINFSITTNAKNNAVAVGQPISFSINNPKGLDITSVEYHWNGNNTDAQVSTTDAKLGLQVVTATVNYEDGVDTVEGKFTIVNDSKPEIYTYKLLNEYPHDITSYTQGLEFYNGVLYESTGQYKESKLRKVDYKTAEVKNNVNLDPQFFGEGLTILDGKLYQLTWQENIGFIYDAETLEKTGSFKYGKSKEGWGLCNDSQTIYKSDGTENIWTLNSETLIEETRIQAYTNQGKIGSLNELEWIDGKIYANIYQRNGVAIINPVNGAVEAVVDFTPLKQLVTPHDGLDVLNGIAYNPETKTIFVTGKRWDKIFEVELVKK